MADTPNEDIGMTHYIVTPVDSSDALKTEALLKDQYGDTSVTTNRKDDITISWSIASSDGELAAAIGALEGVRTVEKQDKGSLPTDDVQPLEPRKDGLFRRDVQKFEALANKQVDPQETEAFLKSKVLNGHPVMQLTARDDSIVGWFNLALDPDAKKTVEDHKGVSIIRPARKIVDFRALDVRQESPVNTYTEHGFTRKSKALFPRANEWVKQEKADKALVMDSQFEGSNLDTLKDYVYLAGSGEGSFIYVIGRGVRTESVNDNNGYEFRPPGDQPTHMEVLQTQTSIKYNQNPHDDDSKNGHETAVASKALGTQWGLAKSATVIPVKIYPEAGDFELAFDLIIKDINARPQRAHRSVIVITSAIEDSTTLADAKADSFARDTFEEPIRALFDLGVPIVCAAGNYGGDPNRRNIDTVPPVYATADFPLINVGAADYNGERLPMSQGGEHLTIYAPGSQVEAQSQIDMQAGIFTGTSIAAPQVAGLIATYLSSSPQPWDPNLKGIERVRAIRDYLVSPQSSWVRKPGSDVRMIWNGADSAAHSSAHANNIAQPTPSSTSPKPTSPPPAPKPTAALSVLLQRQLMVERGAFIKPIYENKWLFFQTPRGVPPGCRAEKDATVKKAGDDKNLIVNTPWPTITQPLKLDGMECSYMNDGKSPGALWCKGRDGPIGCTQERRRNDKDWVQCSYGSFAIERREMLFCEW